MQCRRVSSSRRFVDTMTIRLTQRVTSQRTSATPLREPKIYQYSRTFCITMHQITNAYVGTGPVNQDTVK
jgi:hypothetical protein